MTASDRRVSTCCLRVGGGTPKTNSGSLPQRTPGTTTTVPRRVVWLPGGRAQVGTNGSPLPYDGESPVRTVRIEPFGIDPYAVTNEWFGAFVAATGYRTEAERFGWSLVFKDFVGDSDRVIRSSEAPSWWCRVEGADWRRPAGPHGTLTAFPNHPVVHVSWNDANAFAQWAGGRLPTEAEWECAARGDLSKAKFPWGDQEPDDDRFQPCNIWQGEFPVTNSVLDGYAATAPVDAFAPNTAGLYNMVGNTWEWCADAFRVNSLKRDAKLRDAAAVAAGERLLKGGSYLCHRSYCYRYRIAARSGVSPDSSTGHVGFRLAFSPATQSDAQ